MLPSRILSSDSNDPSVGHGESPSSIHFHLSLDCVKKWEKSGRTGTSKSAENKCLVSLSWTVVRLIGSPNGSISNSISKEEIHKALNVCR